MTKNCDICENEIKFYQLTHRYSIDKNTISLCRECNKAYRNFELSEIIKHTPEKDKSYAMTYLSYYNFTKDKNFYMTSDKFEEFRNNIEKYKGENFRLQLKGLFESKYFR
jgi:hypothetical protein